MDKETFQELDWGGRLLALGYFTGCLSSFLIGLGSVMRMMGSLPETPIQPGWFAAGNAGKPATGRHSGSSYFKK